MSNAAHQPTSATDGPLSDLEREILAFERNWFKLQGSKEQAVRETFQMGSSRYYQLLNALIDNPAALAHDPMLIKRLQRLRAGRMRQRNARRLGFDD